MKISAKQYARALFELVGDKSEKEIDVLLVSFVDLLVAHNQVNRIDRIVDNFKVLWDREHGIVEAEIVSAHSLDKEVEELLREYISERSGAKELELTSRVDKKILGGLVIKYGDHILDASLKNRVQDLKYIMNN